jgi:hypothetical protein
VTEVGAPATVILNVVCTSPAAITPAGALSVDWKIKRLYVPATDGVIEIVVAVPVSCSAAST